MAGAQERESCIKWLKKFHIQHLLSIYWL